MSRAGWSLCLVFALVGLSSCTGGPGVPPDPGRGSAIPAEEDGASAGGDGDKYPRVDRESLIPPDQEKITRDQDAYPVTSLSQDYSDPEPLPYPVNTAGAEDSGFILPDGNTLYVWFTPDVSKPVQDQLTDGVTGIYRFQRENDTWGAAERIPLQDPGKLSLDGCAFILDDRMWFCSAREGYTGLHWFTADLIEGRWGNWQPADFDPDDQVGELHITADSKELYFHSSRPGGKGDYDIWVSRRVDGEWGEPENLAVVNTAHSDGWPFVSPDGTELWLTRSIGAPALFRSRKVDGAWTEPVQMFSLFSGEASLDVHGNVYFTHHYFRDDQMLEADIFVAHRR